MCLYEFQGYKNESRISTIVHIVFFLCYERLYIECHFRKI